MQVLNTAKSLGFLSGSSLIFLIFGSILTHAIQRTLPFIGVLFLTNLLLGVILPKIFPKNNFFSSFHNGLQDFGKKVNFIVVSAALIMVYIFGVGVTALASKIVRKNFLRIKQSGKSSWINVSKKERNFEEMF